MTEEKQEYKTKAPPLPPPMTDNSVYPTSLEMQMLRNATKDGWDKYLTGCKYIKNAKVIDEGAGYINLVDKSGSPFVVFKDKLSTTLLRPVPLESEIMRQGGKDPLNETNKLMYHGINSGLFLYGSAWTSAIMMAWFMFLGYVPSGAIQWVIIGIMILIGILNYPVKASQNPKPKEDKKDERTNK